MRYCPPASAGPGGRAVNLSFELLSDDVVENKIVASRMALTVAEQVSQQFDSCASAPRCWRGKTWTAPTSCGRRPSA